MQTIQKPPGCSCAIRNNSLDAHISCPILNDAVLEKLSTLIADRLRNKSGVGRISPEKSSVCSLTRHGEGWQMVFNGNPCLLFHRSGMIPLSVLLASPYTEFSALDLVRLMNPPPPDVLARGEISEGYDKAELSKPSDKTAIEAADFTTIRAVKARLREITAQIGNARHSNELQSMKTEQRSLEKYLGQVINHVGTPRKVLEDSDRARRVIGKSLTTVMNAIRQLGHHALSRHLSQSIPHPSGHCISYMPDPDVVWEVKPVPQLPPSKAQRNRSGSAITDEPQNTGDDHDD